MMPIQSYSSFSRMTSFCRTKVPPHIWEDMSHFKENDEEIKAYGIRLCTAMCQELYRHGVPGIHFYTLNLENSVVSVLRNLGIAENSSSRRYLT
jgi:methylenetetrahydrofolate reductase (NADPH)